MKKQNIFIDFDGTICFDHFWKSLSTEIRDKITTFLFKQNAKTVEDWMRGKLSSEEINQIISSNTNLDYNHIWNIFKTDCKNMFISTEIIKLIQKCRKNNTVILITDNMDCFNRFTEPELGLKSKFDYIFNSYDYGCLKNDDKSSCLFNVVINKHQFDIKSSILLDNSKKNCNLFEELGGTSILINNEQDILSTLKTLE